MPPGISKLKVGNRQIWVNNYSDTTETQMLRQLNEFREVLLKEENSQLILVAINDNAFVSKAFRQGVDQWTKDIYPKIGKMAFVGLNDIKMAILNDYNATFNRNFQAFSSEEKAIAFLLDNNKTDRL